MSVEKLQSSRISARELNQFLTCALCSGYLVDSVTVTDCFHSFCKSCYVNYLQKPMLVERAAAFLDKCVGCPACLSPLPKPYDTVRKDGLLQSIVFRCIPRLYFSEAERRAAFFERNQMAEKVSPLAVSSVTEKPVYVVLDHLQIDELQRRAAGSSAENAEGTANRDGTNNNYKSQADSNGRNESARNLLPNNNRLHIRCSSLMPLSKLKRFLTLKFGDEAVLFSGDELFDDANRLSMPLGELIALHCCASVYGDRMRSLFEIDPNSEFAHFFFTIL